jgi:hypothetical protein
MIDHYNINYIRQHSINNDYKWNSLLKWVSGIIEILRAYLVIVINKKTLLKLRLEIKKYGWTFNKIF